MGANSEIDYVLVSNGLARAVDKVVTVEGAGTRPHVLVRLQCIPRVTSQRALVLRVPPPMPTERIVGPVRPLPDWGGMVKWAKDLMTRAESANLADVENELGTMYEVWADMAEREVAELTGFSPTKYGLRGRKPKLVWRSTVPEKAKKREWCEADAWRWLLPVAWSLRLQGSALGIDHLGVECDFPDASPDVRPRADDDDPVEDALDADDFGDHADHDAVDLIDVADAILEICMALEDPPEAACRLCRGTDVDGSEAPFRTLLDELSRFARELGDIADILRGGAGDEARREAETRYRAWSTLCDDVTARIKEAAAGADDAELREQRAKWAGWAREKVNAGARNAHRFLRLPEEWRPTTVIVEDGVHTSSPLALLGMYLEKYQRLWHDEDDGAEYCGDPDGWGRRVTLGAPSPAALRDASSAFLEDTSSTYDGFRLRQYRLMSDENLEVVSCMMVISELIGALPPQLRLTATPLIPKPKSGHRSVANFTSFYRLWAKAPRPYVEEWEIANDRPYFAAGKARSTSDLVWRQAARAEASTSSGDHAAALLWDLSSFF